MNVALGIMGVILFALIMVGFYMILNFMSDCLNYAVKFSVFYLITMSILSVAMMKIVQL